MKQSGSGIHVFKHSFEHMEDILNTRLVKFDICTDVHFDSYMSVHLPIVDIFVFGITSQNPL